MRKSGDKVHLSAVLAQLDTWLPTVRRMRPSQPWGDVVRVLNRGQAENWTAERLRRTVRRLVTEGIMEATLLERSPPRSGDDRLTRLVAGIKAATPDRTLQQIAAQHVTLPPDLERFAAEAVADGRYRDVSALVTAGVELLRQRETARAELLRSVRAAEENGDRQGFLTLDEAMADADGIIAEMAGSRA